MLNKTAKQQKCSPHLESTFIVCKLFYSPLEFSSFILASVYIPPQARVSEALQHLAKQITNMEHKHPDSLFIVLGDFNRANLSQELPKYRQHIKWSTRDKNIPDHCYTTLKDAYRSVPHAALGLSSLSGSPSPNLQAEPKIYKAYDQNGEEMGQSWNY